VTGRDRLLDLALARAAVDRVVDVHRNHHCSAKHTSATSAMPRPAREISRRLKVAMCRLGGSQAR